MTIRPVTDLRNHFPEVEKDLKGSGAVYLTKNGYGSAVLISIEEYARLTGKQDMPSKAKPARKSKKPSEGRGYLSKYANPDLIPLEKNAGRMHVAKNYKKYIPEVSEDD